MDKNVYSYIENIFEYLENVASISSVVGQHSIVIEGETNYFDCKVLICDRPTCEDFFILVFNKYLGLIRQIVLDYHYTSQDIELHGLDLMIVCLPCDSQDSEFQQWKKDCKIINFCGNCCISWELPTQEEITIPLDILMR